MTILFATLRASVGSTSVTANADGNLRSRTLYSACPHSGGLRTGEVRYSSGALPTDYTYTGQYSNTADFGLMYYRARWYDPSLGRFANGDPFISDRYNPQAWDRFSYVRNNPLNRIDPTGFVDCNLLDGEDAEACKNTKNLKTLAGNNSTPGNFVFDSKSGRAENVFRELERALGRPLTYEEVLALVAYNEFSAILKEWYPKQYQAALESMGRQFYHFCGADGVCEGNELWKFLGSQEAWYDGDVNDFVEQLKNGIADFSGARQVLNQPYFDQNHVSVANIRKNWRAGNGVPGVDQGNVPFVYGNYSMFPNAAQGILPNSCYCLDETSVYVNYAGSQYVVMTKV